MSQSKPGPTGRPLVIIYADGAVEVLRVTGEEKLVFARYCSQLANELIASYQQELADLAAPPVAPSFTREWLPGPQAAPTDAPRADPPGGLPSGAR